MVLKSGSDLVLTDEGKETAAPKIRQFCGYYQRPGCREKISFIDQVFVILYHLPGLGNSALNEILWA